MDVFLERFVLTVLAASVVTLIVLNPFKFAWPQRASLLVAVVALAYFVGYTIEKRRIPVGQGLSAAPVQTPIKTGDATTGGDMSPAVTGNGNTIQYSAPAESTNIQKPRKKD
jgi:hypothetical protein